MALKKQYKKNWQALSRRVLKGECISRDDALSILESSNDDILSLLDAAFVLRRHYFGRGVRLHVIQNARRGGCSEDCTFCGQSKTASNTAENHPLLSAGAILEGARAADRRKAVRCCIVTSGRQASLRDIETLCEAARKIKAELPIALCVSLGFLTPEYAVRLKEAGIDRYNHNLETSANYFSKICTTHAYADRIATAQTAKKAGLELCSGGLIGLGETPADRVDLAFALRDLKPDSIPVNFFDPRPGTKMEHDARPTAMDCLKTLAMFRFVNPDTEIRAAGGREACLGNLQVLALFAVNSIFTNGYLTTPGQGYEADIAMIKSAGFHVAEIDYS